MYRLLYSSKIPYIRTTNRTYHNTNSPVRGDVSLAVPEAMVLPMLLFLASIFLRSRADLIELSLLYSTCIRDEPLAVFGFVLPETRPRVAKVPPQGRAN
jgi:hypothetical protein